MADHGTVNLVTPTTLEAPQEPPAVTLFVPQPATTSLTTGQLWPRNGASVSVGTEMDDANRVIADQMFGVFGG